MFGLAGVLLAGVRFAVARYGEMFGLAGVLLVGVRHAVAQFTDTRRLLLSVDDVWRLVMDCGRAASMARYWRSHGECL